MAIYEKRLPASGSTKAQGEASNSSTLNLAHADESYLTVDELCGILKLSKKAIYYQVQVKRMPHHRYAGKLRFLLSEVVEWERNSVCRSKNNGGPKCQ